MLYSMNCGGVERALLNLLPFIPKDRYEIHIGLFRQEGELLGNLPGYAHIHHIDCFEKYWHTINDAPLAVIKGLCRKGLFATATAHLLLYIHSKLTNDRYLFFKWLMRNTPPFPEAFDMAVAFAGPSQMIDFYVCDKMRAKAKVGWVHFDVSQFSIDRGMTKRLYKSYEKIFVVSRTAKWRFNEMFPCLRDKTEVFYNILPQQHIRRMADAYVAYDDGFRGKRILTVGRLSAEKGQNVAIRSLKILLDKGYDVKWHFVGDGSLADECRRLAEELNLSGHVVFEGTQVNPYPYMKDCDIYVQPSRYEGYCITLAETKLFPAPIVATCFTGAQEQLSERPNGIVTGMSAEDLAEGIIKAFNLRKLTTEGIKPTEDVGIDKLLALV